jgi:hypothetical protein
VVDPISTVIVFIKINFLFLLFYFFIPSRIIKFDKDEKIMDKFFISLFHTTTIIIILVYILSLLKIYDTISMYISLIIIYILILKFSTNKNSIYSMGMKSVASVLDLSEGRYGLIGGIKNKLISAIEKLKKDFKNRLY